MKASISCLLFASLIVMVLPRGNEGHKMKKNVEQEELEREQFKAFDADNNGYISLSELRILLSEYGYQENAEDVMELFDTNNDNQISFEELQDDSSTSNEEDDK